MKIKHHLCCHSLRTNFKKTVYLKSGAAMLMLFWSFLASTLQLFFLDLNKIIPLFAALFGNLTAIVVGFYAFIAFLQIFYPLAGLLADIWCGRRKCVLGGLWSYVLGYSLYVITFLAFFSFIYTPLDSQHRWAIASLAVMIALIGVPAIIGVLLVLSSVVTFNANVIQFGLDQLHDSPTEHLVLFIHWYVILSFGGPTLLTLGYSSFTSLCYLAINNFFTVYIVFLGFFAFLVFVLLFASLCYGWCKRYKWFLADPGSRNPYKLVYKVIRFACKHKYPLQRSAFTYCEDELPSRLDFAKEKYGGPFTLEEVENVKVFLGILCVLLSLGPLLSIEQSTSILLPLFSLHLTGPASHCMESVFGYDVVPSVLSIVILVVYVLVIRPLFYNYIPGIIKRMWLGMILLIIPTFCVFVLDTVGHLHVSHSSTCFLTTTGLLNDTIQEEPLDITPLYLFIPNLSYSCGYMIFHIAVFEFICSQSPHSMKGLFIGTFYAIRGVFQFLGALLFMLPFTEWKLSTTFPSCGFVFYLINILVALIGIVSFTVAAKRYRYRQRDEPDNIYRYAEEYYEKAEDEPNYDYDDYDNLNVHTVG